MSNVLKIQVTTLRQPDVSPYVDTTLIYAATEIIAQPFRTAIYQNDGSTTNSAATPYPLFTNDTDALAFFSPTIGPLLLGDVNTIYGSSYWTSTDIQLVAPGVESALMSLSMDTLADGSSYKKITSAEKNKLDTLAAVAVSGAYSDITGTPSIPAAQVNSDWNAISGVTKINNKPTLATVATSGAYSDLTGKPVNATVQAYEGITQRLNAFPIIKSATVGSGVVVFNLTNDGTSTGTTLFPNGIIMDSVNLSVNDATASYQMSWAFSNSNKTLTVTANKLTTANILTGILGQVSANGAVVKLQIWGY